MHNSATAHLIRSASATLVVAVVSGCALPALPVAAQDIVRQITALTPAQPHTYEQMMQELLSLRSTGRISLMRLGRTAGGRDIACVAVHDPHTRFGQGKRLFIIARQHGNETSGTEAALALIRHFALSQGELERGTLQHLTIIAVPMANPDGATAGRRRNSAGVDLNRDWVARSQPETAAIERAVRAWQPHAILDLHELPRSSGKAEYAQSFVETIGAGAGIPTYVSGHTLPAAADLASWLGRYRHQGNIYYDQKGKDCRLCHRHFGLQLGIPSFLVEAKTGPGRTLQHRVSLHVLSALVVANYLIHRSMPRGAELAREIGAEEAEPPDEEAPPPTEEAQVSPAVRLRFIRAEDSSTPGTPQIEAIVEGTPGIKYVRFLVDGRLKALSNLSPYVLSVRAEGLAEGEHDVRAEAIGAEGKVLARADGTFFVEALAGE